MSKRGCALTKPSGQLFIAHVAPRLTWDCWMKLHSANIWERYRYPLLGQSTFTPFAEKHVLKVVYRSRDHGGACILVVLATP